MTRVLVVDDDAALGDWCVDGLRGRGFEADGVDSGTAALDAVATRDFDVVVTDLQMAGLDGIELCERLVANHPEVPVVVMTAFGSVDSAVAAMRAGAHDFVSKPFELDALVKAVERANLHRQAAVGLARARLAPAAVEPLQGVVGTSAPMQQLSALLKRVAGSNSTVLITGESGTGKEVVARAIHLGSPRRDGPFIAINCAALPESLLETELFGHTKGAFTGAVSGRPGLFQAAHHGTLFLDELGDLPASLQPKLLRALEERTVRPVGSEVPVPFDVRLLAATHFDLSQRVAEGRFRADLLWRIDVIRAALPPLRSRGEDVLLLAQHFLDELAPKSGRAVRGFSRPVAERLMAYAWPGNVRELRNCIERALAVAAYDELTVDDLPERIQAWRAAPPDAPVAEPSESLEALERRHIESVLASVNGNKSAAARVLGLDRATLYRKLERYSGG